jgi:hypothetical protein
MAVFKPQYGSKTSITISLNSLANNSVAISNTIDNSDNLFQDYLIEVVISGTASSNAFCEVRLLPSEDGTNFGTWESGIPLGTINLSVSPQTAHFSLLNSLFQAPKYFKIAVRNNTGAALSSTGNSASYQGINIVSV